MNPWRQRFKWTVYALLFFDFILYFIQDAQAARYTLDEGSSILEYASAYVTSIDLIAWFTMILLFELETFVQVGRGREFFAIGDDAVITDRGRCLHGDDFGRAPAARRGSHSRRSHIRTAGRLLPGSMKRRSIRATQKKRGPAWRRTPWRMC